MPFNGYGKFIYDYSSGAGANNAVSAQQQAGITKQAATVQGINRLLNTGNPAAGDSPEGDFNKYSKILSRAFWRVTLWLTLFDAIILFFRQSVF